jgi:hypothetical protein
MPRPSPTTILTREYWRPSEAALILGRGSSFWVRAFDQGWVDGYRAGGANGRYIKAESARAYLDSLVAANRKVVKKSEVIDLRQLMRDFRANQKIAREGALACSGTLPNHEIEAAKESA